MTFSDSFFQQKTAAALPALSGCALGGPDSAWAIGAQVSGRGLDVIGWN